MSFTPGGSNGCKVAITLAGDNGSVFGGFVSGPMIAATNVQVRTQFSWLIYYNSSRKWDVVSNKFY